ncbi:MAG: T9SS type A sorting domain-containing protein [bacterium]|nr:T9SS type A sorting domain-containing protein [bacterium]
MFALVLLVMVSCAIAQPVWGPHVVTNTDDEIKEFEVCVRGDTVDVLSLRRNSSNYYGFDLNSTEPLSGYNLQVPGDYPVRQLLDMTAVSSARWVCLLHRNTREDGSSYGSFNFATDLLYGSGSESGMINVETSSYIDVPNYHEGSWTQGHALRVNNARIGVAYLSADIGPFDIWYSTVYREYGLDIELTFDGTLWIGGGYNEPLNRAIGVPLRSDSLLVCSDFGFGGDQNLYIGPTSGTGEQANYRTLSCGDSRILRSLFVTAANRIIAAYNDNSLHVITPGVEGAATCEPYAETPEEWSPFWAFHPNFGFAAIQVHPGSLLLARIDTAGNEVQPVGPLYMTGGPPFIVDADITITDDGKVVAVWSEYTEWGEGPRVLKIAWTNWTTYLGAPHDAIAPLPTDLSLAAYPNPFNSSVTLRYDVPRAGNVELAVYDLQGRLVETLRDELAEAGSCELRWSPQDAASGVYLARLGTPVGLRTTKLLYIR